MVVTKELFTAYLNCPRKAYLKNLGTSSEQTKLGAWQKKLQNTLIQQKLKDPTDAYGLLLKEQGLRFEKELLSKRHPFFVNLKGEKKKKVIPAGGKCPVRQAAAGL